MSKIKFATILFLLIGVSFSSCQMGKKGKFQEYYEARTAVNLSDLIKIWRDYQRASKTDFPINLDEALGIRTFPANGNMLMGESNHFIELPQYQQSNHPFLSQAEDLYNSCLFTYDIWSNQEVLTYNEDNDTLLAWRKATMDSIKSMTPHVTEKELRLKAIAYQMGMLENLPREADDTISSQACHSFYNMMATSIDECSYHFNDGGIAFADSIDSMYACFIEPTKETRKIYKQTADESSAIWMLTKLSHCKNFDEQCALLIAWANNTVAIRDNKWIIAVAERLIDSKKYNPYLSDIWRIWRCLYQIREIGDEQGSVIPHAFFNERRKICYQTCLRHIKSHPHDKFAMMAATELAATPNLSRFGRFFGNEAFDEMVKLLPKRIHDPDEEQDESEPEEPKFNFIKQQTVKKK